jgi:phosphate:Na+ symporter
LVLPTILGANVGIGLTSLLVGLRSWEGRRLATANLLLKTVVATAAFLMLPAIEAWIGHSPDAVVHQAANFHTAFNLVVTGAGILLAAPIGKIMERAVRPARDSNAGLYPTTHLDPASLQVPVFALANATRETLRLADGVKGMLEGAWRAFTTQDARLAAEVQQQDDRIDELNASIKVYLSQISTDAMTPADQQLHFGLLNFSSQLESIADVVDKSLCGTVVEHAREGIMLQPADQKDLEDLHHKVLHRFDMAISVLATRNRTLAKQFLEDSERLKQWSISAQKRHYERLSAATPQALVASIRFLDAFNVLRRISGQLNTIGHTFVLTG